MANGQTHAPANFAGYVLNIRIITGALVAGSVTFGLVAVLITREALGFKPFDVLSLIATVFAAGAVMTSFAMRIVFDKQADAAAPLPAEDLLQRFLNRAIISAAVLEGAAFLNLIVVIVEANAVPLITAAVLIAVMVAGLPTKRTIATWVAARLGDGPADETVT